MKATYLIAVFSSFIFFQIIGFDFTFEPIDVIIPCHDKDKRSLNLVIEGIRKNIQNIRRVIVISNQPLTDQAEWFDEKKFPFTKNSIAYEIFHDKDKAQVFIDSPKTRIGWIFQQMVKVYSMFIIPDISSNMLIVDADTIFLRPVTFQDHETGAGLYATSAEHHQPYFVHNAKVIPGWKKVFPQYSGIVHHMLFQRNVLEELFNTIQSFHNEEPWKVFCHVIDQKELYRSCMSVDYELYFNFVFSHSDQVKIRQLHWNSIPMHQFNYRKNSGFDYLSCHTYMS